MTKKSKQKKTMMVSKLRQNRKKNTHSDGQKSQKSLIRKEQLDLIDNLVQQLICNLELGAKYFGQVFQPIGGEQNHEVIWQRPLSREQQLEYIDAKVQSIQKQSMRCLSTSFSPTNCSFFQQNAGVSNPAADTSDDYVIGADLCDEEYFADDFFNDLSFS